MERTVLFEHIPKTGGITLRGILQKAYGEKQVFFINSDHPEISLDEFSKMDKNQRDQFRVVAGHGAMMYQHFLDNPFRITILRNPVSLFFSQFHYLKITERNRYWKDVKRMNSAEEYLEYALSIGHDNLMTRFMADSMQWAVDPEISPQRMNESGDELLEKAKANLRNFDAVIGLDHFDTGIYTLSKKLNWSHIPLYKPSNRNRKKPAPSKPGEAFMEKLRHTLRFDIQLWEYYKNQNLDISTSVNENSPGVRLFRIRQQMAKYAAKMLGKN